MIGGAGADYLAGGGATDTAVFSGKAAEYSWSKNADGTWTITDLRVGSPDGKDILSSIELLQFSDGLVNKGSANSPTTGATTSAADPHLDLLPLPSYADQHPGWFNFQDNWLGSFDKGFLLT